MIAKEGDSIKVELDYDGGTATLDSNSYVVLGVYEGAWDVYPYVTEAKIEVVNDVELLSC